MDSDSQSKMLWMTHVHWEATCQTSSCTNNAAPNVMLVKFLNQVFKQSLTCMVSPLMVMKVSSVNNW